MFLVAIKLLALLKCGHPCTLICGHQGKHKCNHIDIFNCPLCKRTSKICCPNEIECQYQCSTIFPCGHKCHKMCKECQLLGPGEHVCHKKCPYVFPCGHNCNCRCDDLSVAHQHFICDKCRIVNNIVPLYDDKKALTDKLIEEIRQRKLKREAEKVEDEEDMEEEEDFSHYQKMSDKYCPNCGSKYTSLENEKCYCPTCDRNSRIKISPAFCFPCGHAEPLQLATNRITKEVSEMFSPALQDPSFVSFPRCRMNCNQPLTQSQYFAKEINQINDCLKKYWQKASELKSKNAFPRNKYVCLSCSCGEVHVIDLLNQKLFKCPSCERQYSFSSKITSNLFPN